MARQLSIVGAGIERPDERHIRIEDRVGPAIAVRVASDDLKSRPVHSLRISEDQAIKLIADLAEAVQILRRPR